MNRRTYKDARYAHAKQRAYERLGLGLSNKDCKAIAKLIRKGKAELLERISETINMWAVEYKGCKMKVIYTFAGQQIVTIMPFKDRIDEMYGD